LRLQISLAPRHFLKVFPSSTLSHLFLSGLTRSYFSFSHMQHSCRGRGPFQSCPAPAVFERLSLVSIVLEELASCLSSFMRRLPLCSPLLSQNFFPLVSTLFRPRLPYSPCYGVILRVVPRLILVHRVLLDARFDPLVRLQPSGRLFFFPGRLDIFFFWSVSQSSDPQGRLSVLACPQEFDAIHARFRVLCRPFSLPRFSSRIIAELQPHFFRVQAPSALRFARFFFLSGIPQKDRPCFSPRLSLGPLPSCHLRSFGLIPDQLAIFGGW